MRRISEENGRAERTLDARPLGAGVAGRHGGLDNVDYHGSRGSHLGHGDADVGGARARVGSIFGADGGILLTPACASSLADGSRGIRFSLSRFSPC